MQTPVIFPHRILLLVGICSVASGASVACRDYDCSDTATCPVVGGDAGAFTESAAAISSASGVSSEGVATSGVRLTTNGSAETSTSSASAVDSSANVVDSSEGSSRGDSSGVGACDGNPCEHGTCIERRGDYECDCGDSGFTGPQCDVPIANCELSPCENGGKCTDEGESRVCDCSGTGATGVSCEVDIDECEDNPCEHGVCENGIGEYTCNCAGSGYEGERCEVEIDACSAEPCDPLTVCENVESGFVCSDCPEGYAGTGETGCENIDDCADEPCEHGTCLDRVSGYECDCGTTGYSGARCETLIENCAVSPCENGGTCTDVGSSRTCDCSGTGATGESCEVDIDECASDPCEHGTCHDGVGQYTCDCAGTDYEGVNCQNRVDECAEDPCKNGGACTDGNGSFSCDCSRVDYSGLTCSNRIDDCTPNPCRNGGQCTDGNRSYSCNCTGTGYTGNQCQTDINDCSSNPCKNGGQCTDTGANSFSCACTGVWSGSVCANATLNIDVGAYGYYTNLDWFPPGGWAMVGYGAGLGQYRTFLVFSIPDFDGNIASATLRLNHERYESEQTTETVGIFSVDSTPVSQLGSSSVDWLPGFADLGSGTSYGEFTARSSTLGSILSVPLTGVTSALMNARGSDFALGMAAITLSSSEVNELVHFLIDESDVGQLRLVITP